MSELHVVSKVNTKCTYHTTANYWAPLIEDEDEDDVEDDVYCHHPITISNISDAEVQCDLRATINAWINQRISKNKPFQRKASTMIVDSGATSHFMRAEENLPITGPSKKVVLLPNGAAVAASHTTNLPFSSLSAKARKADVLPALKQNSLVSVGKFADASYTTIFHPHGEGVTVHKPGTFKLRLLRAPVLQGWRDANGLWRLSRDQGKPLEEPSKGKETAANVYNLPLTSQAIRYLHAAAGFPTKDSWIKAINNGNYVTWPGLSAEMANKHFPESVETQKGHLKKQRQNVRSTKVPIAQHEEDVELTRALTKQNILVKVINANQTVYSDQTG